MSHLSLETLARLVDEAPDTGEKSHLDACAACREDLAALRADLAALQALPAIEPPRTQWETVELRLAAEGLLRRPRSRPSLQSTLLRVAAAVAVFALGGAAGVAWADQSPTEDVAFAPGQGVRLPGGDVQPIPGRMPAGPTRTADRAGNVLASTVLSGRMPETRDETADLVAEAEALYLGTLARLSSMGQADDGDPFARLAALEGITAITRAALERSPTDPVLNGYHITALAQREATMRQIAAMTGGSWF